jgi:hypothetical protein
MFTLLRIVALVSFWDKKTLTDRQGLGRRAILVTNLFAAAISI